jgi:tRNA A37 N6-isopentenylltransferase MiaA
VLSVRSVLLLSCLSLVLALSCLWAVHLWYCLRLNRYEEVLQKTYLSYFEQRALKALELHASLGWALARSKAVLERVRDATPEAATTRAALQEVSELLEGMAVESDRAIKELEAISPETASSPDSWHQRKSRHESHSSHDG